MGIPHVLARAAAAACAATGAALAFAAPALADITVTPDQAVQGDAARLTFQVRNDGARTAITRVQVKLPADTPIAEVYPLSVSDWAPQTQTRKLATPIPGVHGLPQGDIVTSITWVNVNKGLPPGGSAELSLEMGPLPQIDKLVFTIEQTNSDRSVVRYTATGIAGSAADRPAPVVALRAPGPGAATHEQAHGGGAVDGEAQPAAAESADAGSGRSNAWWLAGAMLVIGLIAGLGIARQKRAAPAPETKEETREKVGADS